MADFLQFTDKKAWIIVEPGLKGTENQCIALAERLGIGKVVSKYVEMRKPWIWTAPYLKFSAEYAYKDPETLFTPPWPDIIIASGRKSVLAALRIKKLSGNKAFLIQIQNPKLPPEQFDLVIAPHHDGIDGDNVISTLGALHRITPEFLSRHQGPDHEDLAALPRPRIAALIGGKTTKADFTLDSARALADRLKALQQSCNAGLMVTTSRRTGAMQTRILEETLRHENTRFWNGQGSNPYFDYLALADALVVTNDSVSMATEALATGKPVYIYSIEQQGDRIERFHAALQEKKLTKPLGWALEDWQRPAGDDMLDVIVKTAEHYAEFLKKTRTGITYVND